MTLSNTDAGFRQVVQGLLELHELTKMGLESSPQADAIRDALDVPWAALTEAEKNRAQWLSEDLYSVSEPSDTTRACVMDSAAQVDLLKANVLLTFGKWDRALESLRVRREVIAPALLSYLRGRIWSEAGYPAVAEVFFRHAAELEPENVTFQSQDVPF